MSTPSQEPLREELVAAIAKVRHQIEVEQVSDHYIGSGRITAEAIADLQSELDQLEEALANLSRTGG